MLPKIVERYPPNYGQLLTVFGPQIAKAVFAYGDTLYNPSGAAINKELYAHERIHCERQLSLGSVDAWWETYIRSAQFRFDEELLAHRAEFAAYGAASRGIRRAALSLIAKRLSGPLYGNLVPLNLAKDLIRA